MSCQRPACRAWCAAARPGSAPRGHHRAPPPAWSHRDVGRGHHRGQRQPVPPQGEVDLGPWLATIDGICANMVPRVGTHAGRVHARARPLQPARPSRAGPAPPGGVARTPWPWPTRPAAATPWLGSRSPTPGQAAAARGGGMGHVDDRGQAVAGRDGADPATPPRMGRRWQQGLSGRPQLLRDKLVYESGHGAGSSPAHPQRAKRRRAVIGGLEGFPGFSSCRLSPVGCRRDR
jgi:hypothetical protein